MLKGEAKKLYQRKYMREYQRKHRSKQIGLNNVKTQTVKTQECLDPPVRPKHELIKELKNKIAFTSVRPDIKVIEHYCLACKNINNRIREAMEEVEVLSNDVFSKAWMCAEHRAKLALV